MTVISLILNRAKGFEEVVAFRSAGPSGVHPPMMNSPARTAAPGCRTRSIRNRMMRGDDAPVAADVEDPAPASSDTSIEQLIREQLPEPESGETEDARGRFLPGPDDGVPESLRLDSRFRVRLSLPQLSPMAAFCG